MVPIIDLTEENLERRIQRIRERDEEIEKKHREAEADRLTALKMNAMVKIKSTPDDDWPRAHKYDKLDFTYDVKEAEVGTQNIDNGKIRRKPKQIIEYQGPPADPTYNFLADAERDIAPVVESPRNEWITVTSNAHRKYAKNANQFTGNGSNVSNGSGVNTVNGDTVGINLARSHGRAIGPPKRTYPEARIQRQKTSDDMIRFRRENVSKTITTMFPTASRVVGPLKLVGGDYYAKKRSKSFGDLYGTDDKQRSHSTHSSKQGEIQTVKSTLSDQARDRSRGRATLLSIVAIPHYNKDETIDRGNEPQRNSDRDEREHSLSHNQTIYYSNTKYDNSKSKNGFKRSSVQDRLTRHRN